MKIWYGLGPKGVQSPLLIALSYSVANRQSINIMSRIRFRNRSRKKSGIGEEKVIRRGAEI